MRLLRSTQATTVIIAMRTGGKVIFDELRQVLKKTTKIGDIDRSAMKNLNLNEAQVERLAKDVTENDTLQHAMNQSSH